jgi:hypothetical protein
MRSNLNPILFLIIVSLTSNRVSAQAAYVAETFDNSGNLTPVSGFGGYSNTVLNYSGTAVISNSINSNSVYFPTSGINNVYFPNTVGTSFIIANIPYAVSNGSGNSFFNGIYFLLHNYDLNNLNELLLEFSTDEGASFSPLPYEKYGLTFLYNPPGPWCLMTSGFPFLTMPPANNRITLRFTQTSSSKSFRIDDIRYNSVGLLPVRLIQFNAKNINNRVQLSFTASSVNSNSLFFAEKSTDGINFNTITSVPALGNGIFSYTFQDTGILSSKAFYRIKFQDENGYTGYSNTIRLSPLKNQGNILRNIFPLPASNRLHFTLYNETDTWYSLRLTGSNGNTFYTGKILFEKGLSTKSIPAEQLPKGIYTCFFINGTVQFAREIILQ